ncbi:MAG TPA: phosphatase domain-containing protein [Amaricoccus sp.]|nr:phosphatase domain-containing protein [Amaricoccus sp.]
MGALRGLLGVLARPVRRAPGRRGVVLQPYRGYGSPSRIFVIGRAFWQTTEKAEVSELRDILRRIRRRPVRGARIRARFYGAVVEVETDRDGYFRIEMAPGEAPPEAVRWHRLELAMLAPARVAASAEVYIPPSRARVVVVSDIDDTVMHTGVANKAKMLWRLFVQDAESRTVFPGVSHLYRALHAGGGRDEENAMLYVSRAPWGIYELLEEFFRRHAIPVGPILFLREWGISWKHPLPRRAVDHKRVLIEAMMQLYAGMPFVLIGDSGQHDPEVYRQVVEAFPGRIRAIYIREVTARGADRSAEVTAIAEALRADGGHLVLAADSLAIAEDAALLGLIAPEAVAEVRARVRERASEQTPAGRP